MARTSTKTAEEDLLNDVQFDPVFDADGNLVDIVHLEISTDRSRGIRAMEELAASEMPGDHHVGADGWTGKWRRILNSPAPGAAHSIKRTKRWDSQTSAFVPSSTLILPFEVVWTLFDRLFFGRYSIAIQEVEFSSEDVVESSTEGARNLPGRVFYARARLSITLHLENGQTRVFTGMGVAYDSVKAGMTGNVYAINSARRLAEKGAISDAKREALATMGRVFTRAYEDGAEALRAIEEKILEKIRQPASSYNVRVKAPASVPAPRANPAPKGHAAPQREDRHDARGTERHSDPEDDIPEGYMPMEAVEEARARHKAPAQSAAPQGKARTAPDQDRPKKGQELDKAGTQARQAPVNTAPETAATPAQPTAQQAHGPKAETAAPAKAQAAASPAAKDAGYLLLIGSTPTRFATPDAAFDAAVEALEQADSAQARATFLERNKTVLLHAEQDDGSGALTYGDLEALVADVEEAAAPEEDAIPDFQPAADSGLVLQPAKNTGDAILDAYIKAFGKPGADVDAILMANGEWAKQLTKRQKVKLIEAATAAKRK